LKDERKMRLFQPEAYLSVDFRKRKLLVVNNVEFRAGQLPKVKAQRPRFGRQDPLEEELKSFINCILNNAPPRVDGRQGRAALKCALMVQDRVKQGLEGRENLLARSRNLVDVCHERS
jgi:predicted dehydrogenase